MGEWYQAAHHYSWQLTNDSATGAALANSPRNLAKLNLSTPFFNAAWQAGVEAQYVGSRATLQSQTGGLLAGQFDAVLGASG